ncbi:MAG: arsenate reductase ArsC [Betaproteobacteria bacterium]
MYNILFLCTHNSARSVLGEVVALSQSKGMFKGFSAGSDPSGKINPFALEIADELGVSRENLYSKSWDEFAKVGSPQMDFIITVCDNAANEVCPIWPGNPTSAHWGFEDPSQVTGDENTKRAAFRRVAAELTRRIQVLCSMPLATMSSGDIENHLRLLGKS